MKATQMETRKKGSKKRSKINGSISLVLMFLLIGCATTDVVYVPPGDAVKLRETITDAKVWIKTTEKIVLPGTTTLYEGWF